MKNFTKRIFLIAALSSLANHSISQQVLQMGKGVELNGDIYCVKADSFNNRIFVSGNFDQVSGIATSGVAYQDSLGWHAMGSGVDGIASAMEVTPTGVYVGGSYSISVIDDPTIHGIVH